MNILILDPDNLHTEKHGDFTCALDDIRILSHEDVGDSPSDAHPVDVIVGIGDFSRRSDVTGLLLAWRTHPHTYMIPCWILASLDSFERGCLWPRLAIDRFQEKIEASRVCDWLSEVIEWQQNRMHIGVSHSFADHSALELTTALSLRKASGTLSVFDDEGTEGSFVLHEGHLISGAVKHLRGLEAFIDFLSWSSGSYHWQANGGLSDAAREGHPLDRLIREALQLTRDANLLFHFLPDLRRHIVRTESESALDDGAVPHYREIRKIYHFIEGTLSAQEIIEISPLSRPRTMNCLAKWFSLGDIRTAGVTQPAPKHRLLIVDDSKTMCRALQFVFSKDPRFEIVGIGHDGYEALRLIEEHGPDVVTLDIQMPKMDGLTTLKHIMIRDPRPVVILSAFTKETSQQTYESFKYGAVDVFAKPAKGGLEKMEAEAAELRNRIVQASCVRMEAAQYIRRSKGNGVKSRISEPSISKASDSNGSSGQGGIVTLCGAGGFPSLLKLLLTVSKAQDLPPMIICAALSRRVVEALIPNLQKDSQLRIEELPEDRPLVSGVCYLYSYEEMRQVVKEEGFTKLKKATVQRPNHRPFDSLLRSAANILGDHMMAILISGTGEDGVDGMRVVREMGGQTLVLSPKACLKPDLPQMILDQGFAKEVRSAAELAGVLEGYPKALATISSSVELTDRPFQDSDFMSRDVS